MASSPLTCWSVSGRYELLVLDDLDEAGVVRFAEHLGQTWAKTMAPNETRVLGLDGQLGAGKTVFVRGLVSGLPGGNPQEVTSPTYALLHTYGSTPPVRHMDLYRIRGPDEIEELGEDLIYDSPGLVVIEWFERARATAPVDRIEIRLDIEGSLRRKLSAAGYGRGRAWMDEIT